MSVGIRANFTNDLAESQAVNDKLRPILLQLYPGATSVTFNDDDNPAQRAGVDCIVHLAGGHCVTCDIKNRFKPFDDIALEYLHVHNDGRQSPGWVCKPLECDEIVYVVWPLGRAYRFPRRQLQAAWERHQHEWFAKANQRIDGFSIVPAQNRNYYTLNVAVPISLLLSAISSVSFQPQAAVRRTA